MKKNYLFVMALAAMVSCSSDEFVGDSGSPNVVNGNGGNSAISFGFDVPQVTRASGSSAASDLSNQFIVYGEKSETEDGAAAAAGKLVFGNYLVKWTDNSAYTTTSNTKNWEYVGISATSEENSNITPNSGTEAQTIKYWDYSATNYVFTAVSALPADIQNGRVKIKKIVDASSTASNKVFNKGYIIEFNKTGESTYASFDKLYFSDRQVISQGTGTDRTATNAYGGNVTLTFRNALSQVRVGIYETISGYSISDIHFFVSSDNEAKVSTTDAFGAICPNIKCSTYTEALKVTYEPSGDVANHPIVAPVTKNDNSVAVTPEADLILGTNTSLVTTSSPLGTTTTSPTWDTSGGTFTPVFPQAGNTTNLTLKCNYTLYNSVSGETIIVTGATAKIPYQYLQWKPNFKYTYLFKISENTNGQTGGTTGPAGLYPITFDAIEVVAEDGNVEYITTVSEPSITTFGTVTSAGKTTYVSGGSDYALGTAVYATVMDGSSLATLSASNMQLYTVTTTDDTNFPITEASVAEALIEGPTLNAAQATAAKIKLPTNPALTYQKTVPAEDGTTITLDASNDKAATFTTAANTKYALVYQKTAATYTTDGGKNDYTSETFTAAGTLYTDAGCTTKASSWTSGTTYYKRTAVSNKGEYVIKIVTCP